MRPRKRILVLGYFGRQSNQIDGQTIKTRSIYELLKDENFNNKYSLSSFDTESLRLQKRNILKIFRMIWRADRIVYIAAQNSLLYIFPLIYFISKLRKTQIHYIVVGGWLSDFIKNKPFHIQLLRKIDGIYPETKALIELLRSNYNFQNLYQLHNFRINKNPTTKQSMSFDEINLVFMARVHPKKGVDVLFDLDEKMKEMKINQVKIDVYGPVDNLYLEHFKSRLSNCSAVNYKGVLKPQEIPKVLANYHLMLFPTRYFTEGSPGSVLDAYMAGIPVIATNWRYAAEFIEHNISGIITPFGREEDFINSTLGLLQNTNDLLKLKKGAEDKMTIFNHETAWKIFEEKILI